MASRQITMGPGEFDLAISLFRYSEVRFVGADPFNQLSARIKGIEEAPGEDTWTLKGFVIHGRPIQKHQDFAATYSTITRSGSAYFTETCKACEGPLDSHGFCERCAGGLPLKVCAALELKTLPAGGATLGFGLTAEEAACLRSTGRVTLKSRVTVGLHVNKHIHLYETPENTLINMQTRVMKITPPPPTEPQYASHTADVEIIA